MRITLILTFVLALVGSFFGGKYAQHQIDMLDLQMQSAQVAKEDAVRSEKRDVVGVETKRELTATQQKFKIIERVVHDEIIKESAVYHTECITDDGLRATQAAHTEIVSAVMRP